MSRTHSGFGGEEPHIRDLVGLFKDSIMKTGEDINMLAGKFDSDLKTNCKSKLEKHMKTLVELETRLAMEKDAAAQAMNHIGCAFSGWSGWQPNTSTNNDEQSGEQQEMEYDEDGEPVASGWGSEWPPSDKPTNSEYDKILGDEQFDLFQETDSMRYIFASHGLIQRNSDVDCQHEECKSEMKCQQRHSISAPDLRTTSASSVLPHSGRSSPSTAISSPTSVLTQILSVPHHNPFASSSTGTTTTTSTTTSNHHHHHHHHHQQTQQQQHRQQQQQQQQHHHHHHHHQTQPQQQQQQHRQQQQHHHHHQNHNATSPLHEPESPISLRQSNEFLYLLQAPTSMATKVNEETMTYLNQGQSYEINLKKLGDLSDLRGKMLKSIIRIGFHERRLQYMEKDLILQWKQSRQSERILEIDIPLSYGIYENKHNFQEINKCEFLWEPSKDTGVFVKVNCISTEFTPKKHGGEKGVPFRLIIETHAFNDGKNDATTILHAASCQIKVFKPKGADRKHKTDREKMSKRPKNEQEKFKPSSDRTAFTDYPINSLYASTTSSNGNTGNRVSNGTNANGVICNVNGANVVVSSAGAGVTSNCNNSSVSANLSRCSPPSSPTTLATLVLVSSIGGNGAGGVNGRGLEEKHKNSPEANNSNVVPKRSPSLSDDKEQESGFTNSSNSTFSSSNSNIILSSEASSEETVNWLALNRFDSYIRTFSNFSGSDLLKMTRSDLIQICGLTDGIRLFNALHIRSVKPKLTLYVCNPMDEVFRAVYLENLSILELKTKLESMITCSNDCHINRICLQGPSGIHVLMTDEVIRNFTEESIFFMKLDRANDQLILTRMDPGDAMQLDRAMELASI